MSAPTVSVVIAAYNGAAWLRETLASLSAQTFGDWEAVVVDDCSTDHTRELVRAWPDKRVRLVALERNGGAVHARNRAVAEAHGRYLAALDQDDLCRPQRFARQVAWLDANPDAAGLGTAVECLADGAVRPSAYPVNTTPGLIDWLLQLENPLAWSSMMIRADAARGLDPFTRPGRIYAEDFDLYHRLRASGRIARLDTPLLLYRRHAGGMSRHEDRMTTSAALVLAERHAGLPDPERAGALLARHVMDGRSVPDRATLAELGALLSRLQAKHLQAAAPDPETRRLIQWETAQRWARIGRAGLRSGTLTLADVLAVRPAHLGLGYAGIEAHGLSGLVGSGRRLARRHA